jgi:hypothetical protein
MTLRLALMVFILGLAGNPVQSEEPKSPSAVPMNEQEQAFARQISGVVLEGSFSLDASPEAHPVRERYEIQSVQKLKDHDWMLTARIVYGDFDIPLPVPVQVYWADKTPVLQVSNLKLPGLGEGFTARILFQDQRYAGTWQHGANGGLMGGRITRPAASGGTGPQPSPAKRAPE